MDHALTLQLEMSAESGVYFRSGVTPLNHYVIMSQYMDFVLKTISFLKTAFPKEPQ